MPKDPGFTYRRPISVALSIAIHGVFVSHPAARPKGDSEPATRVCTDCASFQAAALWGARRPSKTQEPSDSGRGGFAPLEKRISLSCGCRWKAASNTKQQTKTLRLLTTSEYSLIAQQNLFTVTSVDAGNLRAGVSKSADRSHVGLHSACTATWSAVTHLTEKEQSTSSLRR